MGEDRFGRECGLIPIDSHLRWSRILKRLRIDCDAHATWWRMPENQNMKLIRIEGDFRWIGERMQWATYFVDGHTIIASHGLWFRAGEKTVWAKENLITIE